jgi:two-component system nitrogen regulation response regulator GlnG
MSDEALAHIATLPFPGNVRQLENLCNWLTVMAPAQMIEIKDLPADLVRGSAQMLPAMGESAARQVFVSEPSHEPYAATPASDVLTTVAAGASSTAGWERALAGEAKAMLEAGQPDVMDVLTRRFEKAILEAALGVTRGRRVEAATRLGIGRNTITRKLQELGFD